MQARDLIAAGQVEQALRLADAELLSDLDHDWVLDARSSHRALVIDLLTDAGAAAEAAGDLAAVTLQSIGSHADAVASLTGRFRGELITPADPTYDSVRRVWNGMIDKRPAVIARCADGDDVALAVRAAREHGLALAVRGGDHNVAGTATCDDGIVVDLSAMRDVRIDHARRTVHVQAGATWGDVDRVTAPLGLATPGGVVSETGVAGLALSGGVSSQRRAHGMTIDNLVSAEVVLADGRRVRASADEHADLHWALRGGGGNFGVVTSFELRLHDLGPDVFSLDVFYPIDRAAAVLAAWRNAVAGAPDELTTEALLWTLPLVPEMPEHLRGRPFVGVSGMYAGAPEEGERVTRHLRALATPLLDMSGTVAYLDVQCSLDEFFPAGLRYYWKALYLDALSDEAIAAMVSFNEGRPSDRSLVIIRHGGGAISRVGAHDTAFGDRSSEFMLSIDATWEDPADDDANIAWTRALWQDARRFSAGKTYFNFPGLFEEGNAALRASYGDNFERLAQIKATYDPQNLFRLKPEHPPVRMRGPEQMNGRASASDAAVRRSGYWAPKGRSRLLAGVRTSSTTPS